MQKDARMFVAGHKGLVGSAIVRTLQSNGYSNLLLRSRAELDLSSSAAVLQLFERERPQFVFLAAAHVGGILANQSFPVQFLEDNLRIQQNVIHAAYRSGVERLLFLGSSCIYPRECPQPIREEYLLSGYLEPSNRAYALAKILGIEQCWCYNRQYGTRFIALMPCNLFGPGDNYHPQNSHVLPALMRRLIEARNSGSSRCIVWGSGRPLREFMLSDECANACLFTINLPEPALRRMLDADAPPILNVGSGEEVSIRELAELIAAVVGFKGTLEFDSSRPDGTPRKLLDCSRIHNLGWYPSTGLVEGIRRTYESLNAANEFGGSSLPSFGGLAGSIEDVCGSGLMTTQP